MTDLSSVRIVCVSPLYGGNVGAVCRAALNFGVETIRVVNPQCDIHGKEARLLATGNSKKSLEAIDLYSSLRDAIQDCATAIAFTRRLGRKRTSTQNILELSKGSENETIALVFGPEDTGLTQQEVNLCNFICSIPTSDKMPSMNLSLSVGVVLSHMFQSTAEDTPNPQRLACHKETQSVFSHLKAMLGDVGYKDGDDIDRMHESLVRILNRSHLTYQETQVLHGLLRSITK